MEGDPCLRLGLGEAQEVPGLDRLPFVIHQLLPRALRSNTRARVCDRDARRRGEAASEPAFTTSPTHMLTARAASRSPHSWEGWGLREGFFVAYLGRAARPRRVLDQGHEREDEVVRVEDAGEDADGQFGDVLRQVAEESDARDRDSKPHVLCLALQGLG